MNLKDLAGLLSSNCESQVNQPFTRADVLETSRKPVLSVRVTPKLPTGEKADSVIPSPIKEIFFKARGAAKVVLLKPDGEMAFLPKVWKNALGATVEYNEVTVTFDPGRAANLPGDYRNDPELIVLTEAGERSCPIRMSTLEGFAKNK